MISQEEIQQKLKNFDENAINIIYDNIIKSIDSRSNNGYYDYTFWPDKEDVKKYDLYEQRLRSYVIKLVDRLRENGFSANTIVTNNLTLRVLIHWKNYSHDSNNLATHYCIKTQNICDKLLDTTINEINKNIDDTINTMNTVVTINTDNWPPTLFNQIMAQLKQYKISHKDNNIYIHLLREPDQPVNEAKTRSSGCEIM